MPCGSLKIVTTIGHVKLTPTLILYNVLFIPEFHFNLLSVGKLLITQNLLAQFLWVFQDLSTNRVVAVGRGS